MTHFKFFTSSGEPTFEFTFNSPSVEYKENLGWVVINASGRTITLSGTSMLAYDDDIQTSRVLMDLLKMSQREINDAYKDSDKIMMVFSKDQVPIMMLHGKALKFISKYNDLTTFTMDEKPIWLYNMNFLILSRS